ncbi:phosphoribosyltransferase [Paraburkholderia strydomiana]|uniref:phosphoribosyltransferase n=1 Tax=Paraburkholderia strydomiana TaxID=1245417 RepID=UPI0038B73B5E
MEASVKKPKSPSLLGKFAQRGTSMRTLGFPPELEAPVFLWTDDARLKAHPRYGEAKAGDLYAAIELVHGIANELAHKVMQAGKNGNWPRPLIFVAPHAREARGDNAIPQVVASVLDALINAAFLLQYKSNGAGGVDVGIVQTTKVYHTGADAMERLIARAAFQGPVYRGGNYVLVDDVTTLGGTLCDLSDHIRRGGGNVVAAVVLVNASRSGRLAAAPKTVRRLEEKFGHVIRKTFHIEPSALTADEAQYLIGFRTAEEIRGRRAKAKQTTDLRLRSKGIYITSEGATVRQGLASGRRRVKFSGAGVYSTGRWIKQSRR